MKLLFSVPTGYHLRELVLPLRNHLENDPTIETVYIITPAADVQEQVFIGFGPKFQYHKNPESIEGHSKLFKQLAADIVITNTVGHDELDYPILKAAGDIGIQTFTFIASWDNVWKIERLQKAGKPIHIADHTTVWNNMMKKHLLRIAPLLSEDQVSICGAPRMDYFWHESKIPSKQELFDYIHLENPSKPLIHVATTELYPMDYVVKAIAKAQSTKQIPQSHIYASVHPGGDISKHKTLENFGATVRYSFGRQENSPHPSFAYIPTEKDIYMLVALFKHADVLVNHSSSTALESIIASTPVINVKYGKPLDWWNWRRSMVYRDFDQHYIDLLKDSPTYVALNRKQLLQSMKRALGNPTEKQATRAKTLERMMTVTDGTASQKVLTQIKKSVTKR